MVAHLFKENPTQVPDQIPYGRCARIALGSNIQAYTPSSTAEATREMATTRSSRERLTLGGGFRSLSGPRRCPGSGTAGFVCIDLGCLSVTSAQQCRW